MSGTHFGARLDLHVKCRPLDSFGVCHLLFFSSAAVKGPTSSLIDQFETNFLVDSLSNCRVVSLEINGLAVFACHPMRHLKLTDLID